MSRKGRCLLAIIDSDVREYGELKHVWCKLELESWLSATGVGCFSSTIIFGLLVIYILLFPSHPRPVHQWCTCELENAGTAMVIPVVVLFPYVFGAVNIPIAYSSRKAKGMQRVDYVRYGLDSGSGSA